jgi:hypothetical protein
MSGTSLASSARQARYTGGAQAGKEGVLICRAAGRCPCKRSAHRYSCSWSHMVM